MTKMTKKNSTTAVLVLGGIAVAMATAGCPSSTQAPGTSGKAKTTEQERAQQYRDAYNRKPPGAQR